VPAAVSQATRLIMRVVVDLDLCQGHAVCQGEAPEIFRVVDRPGDYARVEVILERPPEDLRPQAEAAARYCPNRVITIVED
jgi:ferredoxin